MERLGGWYARGVQLWAGARRLGGKIYAISWRAVVRLLPRRGAWNLQPDDDVEQETAMGNLERM